MFNASNQGHRKTASGTSTEVLRNSNLEPAGDQEALMKAYTNLDGSSYLMMFLQSSVDRRVELVDEDGKMNPIILNPRANVQFGLALTDNSSIVLKGTILGTNTSIYLNQHIKVRIQPENNIYKQAHIVIADNSSQQNSKLSAYATSEGGESRLNMSGEIQKSLQSIVGNGNEITETNLTGTIRNKLGTVVEVIEITGAVAPMMLLPFQEKLVTLSLKSTSPLIFKANSGKPGEELLLNGQRQLRVYVPSNSSAIDDIIINGNTGIEETSVGAMNAVMLVINNTLQKPVVLFDIASLMRPIVIPENQLCQIGFFVKGDGFVVLSGVDLGDKPHGVLLNKEIKSLVSTSKNPAQQSTITITQSEPLVANVQDQNGKENEDQKINQGSQLPQSFAEGKERFVMLDVHNPLNTAAKMIELTGVRKPFVVPAHAYTKIGFSVISKGPVVFRASKLESNEGFLLNKETTIRVETSEDPGKISEIEIGADDKTHTAVKRHILPSLSRLILLHR